MSSRKEQPKMEVMYGIGSLTPTLPRSLDALGYRSFVLLSCG